MLPDRFEFPRAALLLMGAGTFILAIIVGTSIWLASATSDLGGQVLEARKMRTAESDVLDTLLDAKTSQRCYLLTGKARYLGPYVAA